MAKSKVTLTKEERQAVKELERNRAARKELLEGLPVVNLGALFMPPIWGAANGILLSILFYPLWLFADNLFYSAFSEPNALNVALSVVVFVMLAAATILFAYHGQWYGLVRALDRGMTKEQYAKRQRTWAIAMAAVAILFIVLATWYNLDVRPGLDL